MEGSTTLATLLAPRGCAFVLKDSATRFSPGTRKHY
jgi:hypothetical protein